MNDIFNIINITADSETELREALQNAIQSNFVDYFNSNIKITNRKCPNIKFNFSTEANYVDILYVDEDNNVTQTITSLTYSPYISRISYKSYYDESYDLTKYITSFKNKYTILIALLIDVNIIGFSIISPSDLELLNKTDDNGYSLYTLKSNKKDNSIVFEDNTEDISSSFPEHIKIQSGIINDTNSYYEIGYINLKDSTAIKYLPCIEGTCYDVKYNYFEDGTLFNTTLLSYKLESELKDKYSDINVDNIDNTDTNSSLLILPKLLVSDGTILGYTSDIYDCPNLSIPTIYTEDSYNAGDILALNNSNYLIVDNNTLVRLFNCEIISNDCQCVYDNKVHFISLTCPNNSKIYYNFNNEDSWTPLTDINNITITEEQANSGVCKNIGTWQVNYKVVVDVPTTDYLGNTVNTSVSYYGSNYVNITPASINGYYIANTSVAYDGNPHSVVIYIDDSYTVKYSLDNATWYSTPITFTEIGTYTVYYQISKQNYTTIQDKTTLNIQTSTGTITPDPVDDNLLTLNTVSYSSGITKHMWYYVMDDQNVLVAENKINLGSNVSIGKCNGPGGSILDSVDMGYVNVTPSKCYIYIADFAHYCLDYINGEMTNDAKITVYAESTKDTSVSIKVTDKDYCFMCIDDGIQGVLINADSRPLGNTSENSTKWLYSYGRKILVIDLTSPIYNKLDRLRFHYNSGTNSNLGHTMTYETLLPCTKLTLNKKTLDLGYYLKAKGTLNNNTVITSCNNETVTSKLDNNAWYSYEDDCKYYKLNKYTLNYQLNTDGKYEDYIYSKAGDTSSDRLQLKQGVLTHVMINNDNLAPTVKYKSGIAYPISEEEQRGSGTISFMLETLSNN